LPNNPIVKNYNLGDCIKLSKERRAGVVVDVVNMLLESGIPGDEKQQTMFDPAHIISQTLDLEYVVTLLPVYLIC
jgi:hypothetical protein